MSYILESIIMDSEKNNGVLEPEVIVIGEYFNKEDLIIAANHELEEFRDDQVYSNFDLDDLDVEGDEELQEFVEGIEVVLNDGIDLEKIPVNEAIVIGNGTSELNSIKLIVIKIEKENK